MKKIILVVSISLIMCGNIFGNNLSAYFSNGNYYDKLATAKYNEAVKIYNENNINERLTAKTESEHKALISKLKRQEKNLDSALVYARAARDYYYTARDSWNKAKNAANGNQVTDYYTAKRAYGESVSRAEKANEFITKIIKQQQNRQKNIDIAQDNLDKIIKQRKTREREAEEERKKAEEARIQEEKDFKTAIDDYIANTKVSEGNYLMPYTFVAEWNTTGEEITTKDILKNEIETNNKNAKLYYTPRKFKNGSFAYSESIILYFDDSNKLEAMKITFLSEYEYLMRNYYPSYKKAYSYIYPDYYETSIKGWSFAGCNKGMIELSYFFDSKYNMYNFSTHFFKPGTTIERKRRILSELNEIEIFYPEN